MIKAIIFDFDGTLADSLKLVFEVEEELADEFGFKKIKYSRRVRDTTLLHLFKEKISIPKIKLPLFFFRMRYYLTQDMNKVRLFEKMKPVLKDLSEDYELYILTSNLSKDPVNSIGKVLRREKIYFMKKIYPASFFRGKREALRKLLHENGLKTNEVLYIGDEIGDVRVCNEVGIKILAVSWGYHSKEFLKKNGAHYIIDKPSEILNMVSVLK